MAVRVLIVDDDDVFRATACLVLERGGYEVVGGAATIAEAREAVAALHPDALLVDVNLPDGDGWTLAGELRETRKGLHLLVTSSDATAAPAGMPPIPFVSKTALAVTDLSPYLGA
jgi:CheY-like chemotaxis protein